jgi:hypothetical protein
MRFSAPGIKKADAAEHPEAFCRVGLLGDESPGKAELLFIQSSNIFKIQAKDPAVEIKEHWELRDSLQFAFGAGMAHPTDANSRRGSFSESVASGWSSVRVFKTSFETVLPRDSAVSSRTSG